VLSNPFVPRFSHKKLKEEEEEKLIWRLPREPHGVLSSQKTGRF